MIDVGAFISELVEPSTRQAVREILIPGFAQPLPVMVLDRHPRGVRCRPLIVCFHGALDQSKRPIPAFEGRFLLAHGLRGEATIVSIADPSLGLHPGLKTAWYAGNETTDTPGAIAAFVAQLVCEVEPSRLIFVGGSTGAHAALVQSFRMPGSVAVVKNPILHISAYHARHNTEYRKFCWPHLRRLGSLPVAVNDNVARLYANGSDNTVILLNNTRDAHFWTQAAVFLHAIRSSAGRNNCLLYSDFFAEFPGHSFPPSVWARWVKAACRAPSTSIVDIGNSLSDVLPASTPSVEHEVATHASSDLDVAQQIYRQLMAKGTST